MPAGTGPTAEALAAPAVQGMTEGPSEGVTIPPSLADQPPTTSQPPPLVEPVGPPFPLTSCTMTIGSGLQSAIASAPAGAIICLSPGDYGSIEVDSSKSSTVTITPADGVSRSRVVLGYTEVTTSSNLTFRGVTIGGGNAGSPSAPATHIHWIGDAFTSGLCIQTPTSANIDVSVDSSTFTNIDTGGCGNEGRLEVNGDNVPNLSGINGVAISYDLFHNTGSGCTDGVNLTGGASGTRIGPGDEFTDLEQGSCAAHVDPIQFYGAHGTTVEGDYFAGNSTGIMSPDGNGSPMIVENNVFDTDGEYPDQIVVGGGERDIINHNTLGHGAHIRIGRLNAEVTSIGETITNNVLTGGLNLSDEQPTTGWTMFRNLVEGEPIGTNGIGGEPTYLEGDTEPSTWAGWHLARDSLGHLAASDGTDIGSNYFGF